MAPYFSVIMPTYNRAHLLWRTILAVQGQGFSDWELLVIDDGSTDATAKLMTEFQQDHRIRYTRIENGGPSAARNAGLAQALGEIIVYVDSDDYILPQFLSVARDYFTLHPDKSFAVCNHSRRIEYRDRDNKLAGFADQGTMESGTVTLQDFYDWRVKTTSTGLFHRRLPFAGKAAWRDTVMIEDLEFLMQLAALDEAGFIYIPLVLVYYTQRYGSEGGMCAAASYNSYARAFGAIYTLHKDDPLMKNPAVYLDRVQKYNDLHQKVLRGEERPNGYKYFPELWGR